jgi:hypothetical protein
VAVLLLALEEVSRVNPGSALECRSSHADLAESFFGLLKRERVNRVRSRTREQAPADVFD